MSIHIVTLLFIYIQYKVTVRYAMYRAQLPFGARHYAVAYAGTKLIFTVKQNKRITPINLNKNSLMGQTMPVLL